MSRSVRSNTLILQGIEKCIEWYQKIGVHFLDIFFHNLFYLTKQKYPGSFTISLLEYCANAVKSFIGHYNSIGLELREYKNQFTKLIRASEKKRNPTLRCRVPV